MINIYDTSLTRQAERFHIVKGTTFVPIFTTITKTIKTALRFHRGWRRAPGLKVTTKKLLN